jgi:proteasome lid subunit RPN8/RPN11
MEKKKVGSGLKDNTMIIIKPKAYVKMKKHVLRFGSKAKSRDEYRECMGMLMGKLQDGKNPDIKDVVVLDAVPVSHGGKVEVAFAPEDYVNFSIIDSQFAEKGLFNIGWYHSHPGLSCFFSAVDIRNQLGFQTANPSAIGLVFDHERFKDPDDMGFDAYRLDEPSQGQMSDYHELDWMVEAPEDHTFYTESIKNLIDSYHKGEPPILELSEVPDIFGELSMPGRNSMMAKEPELNFAAFSENLSKGVSEMVGIFFQPFFEFLNKWATSISKGLIDKNIEILEVVVDLKKNLSDAIGGLQGWFKFQINDRLRDIDILIDDQLEMLTNQQGDSLNKIEELDVAIKSQIGEAFTKAIGKTLTKVTKNIDDTLSKFKVSLETSDSLLGKIKNQKSLVSSALEEYDKQTASLVKSTKNLLSSAEMTINSGIGVAGKEVDDIVLLQKDFLDSLKALTNMVNQI